MLRGSFVACLNMIKYKPISHQKTRENDKRLAYHIAGPEQNRTELSRRSGGEHASGMKISIQTLIAHVTHIHSAVHAQWFVSGSRFCMVIGIASELSSREMAVPALVHYSIPFASIKCIWWLGFVHTNLRNYYWFSVAYLSKAFMIFAPSDLLLLHPFRSPIMLKYIRFFARMNSLFTRSKIATANTIAPLNELHLQNTKCFFSSSAFICIAYFVIAVVVLFYCHCRTYLVGKVAVVVWLTHLNFFNCL